MKQTDAVLFRHNKSEKVSIRATRVPRCSIRQRREISDDDSAAVGGDEALSAKLRKLPRNLDPA